MGIVKENVGDDNNDWVNIAEAKELMTQMTELEQKISNFKKEINTQDNDDHNIRKVDKRDKGDKGDSKCSKPIYITDSDLPKGWTYFRNREGSMFYRDAMGKFIKNRRNI